MLSTVTSEVALTVAIDIETAGYDSSGHGPLPDTGVNYLPLPLDVAR
jgi:hypothetical protein